MKRKFLLVLTAIMIGTLCGYSADIDKLPKIDDSSTGHAHNARRGAEVQKDTNTVQRAAKNQTRNTRRNTEVQNNENSTSKTTTAVFDKNTIYYPNANLKSSIAKYKSGNYIGCLQELFSLTKKDPSNSVAYYYMAMAYTHLDMKDDAIAAYEKVLTLRPNPYLAEYAIKGRDCLTDGPACKEENANEVEETDELDEFINAPYGNGLSKKLNDEVKQKQLNNFRQTINRKEQLENNDIQKIREFDVKNNKSSIDENDKIAAVSDEEVLNAINTLKAAGVNVTVQQDNPYAQMNQYQDPQMAELSMMLGGNNNNNNNMMNMVPLLMAQSQQGKNVDPRLMQAMLMNSMMSDLSFSNNNNNRY